MKVRLTAVSIIVTVTVTALFGMVLGGGFGYLAGRIAPQFFEHLVSWAQLEPLGVAVMLGAFGGVLCGGFLGGFAIAIQTVAEWVGSRRVDS